MNNQIIFQKDGFHDEQQVIDYIEEKFLDPFQEINDEENILDISSRISLDDLPKETVEAIRHYYQGIIKKNDINKTIDEFLDEEDIIIRYYDTFEVNEDLSITYKLGFVATYAKKYQFANEEFGNCKSSVSEFVISKFKDLGFAQINN